MLAWGKLAGGLGFGAAVAAQAKPFYDVVRSLKYLSDMSGEQQASTLAWLAAAVVTAAACAVCIAGRWLATLLLGLGALTLNLLATALAAHQYKAFGLSLGAAWKLLGFGVSPGGGSFTASLFFGGIVTWLLLAVSSILVANARGGAAPQSQPGALAGGWAPTAQKEAAAWQGTAAPQVAAGWYPHPSGNGSVAYWDGAAWLDVPAPQP